MIEISDFQKMNQVRARVDATVKDPKTAEALKPWYRQFCKRPTFNDGRRVTLRCQGGSKMGKSSGLSSEDGFGRFWQFDVMSWTAVYSRASRVFRAFKAR
jgi:hypothetical protein